MPPSVCGSKKQVVWYKVNSIEMIESIHIYSIQALIMECKDCGRVGHPTDRCLYRCKVCRIIHREGDCPLVVTVRKLITVLDGASIPEEAKQLLKDLNC